jgi:hypothetical protein
MNYNYKNTIWIIIVIITLLLVNIWLKTNVTATATVKEGFESVGYEVTGLNKPGLNPDFTSIGTLEATFKPAPGFVPWPKDLMHRFKIYQKTVSRNVKQYNMYVLQQQATAEEAETLINTGYWPWPDDLKDEYIKAVWRNPIIKIDAGSALQSAQEMYCKNAAMRLLGWNTKEGQFLLAGVDAGRTDAMPVKNTIKCSADLKNSVLQKTVYKSYNLFNGYKNSETTTIKNEDIPSEVTGFSFVNGPCNPCNAINQTPQYNCPFKLAIKDQGSDISPVWKSLWGL